MASSVFSDAYGALMAILISARRQTGLTQGEVARRLGKPQSYVSKYETGERRLDLVEFCAISTALDISPLALFEAFLQAASAREPRFASDE